MMKRMIYFTRHGESQANVDNIFAGPTYPAPLTEKGREQAKTEGEKIKSDDITIDRIICSPMPRARETANIIAETIDFDSSKIQIDPRLREYDMGALSGTSMIGVTPLQRVSAENAEDPVEFQSRVMSILNEIKALTGNTLVVSHAGVGRMIEATKRGLNPTNFYEIDSHPNALAIILD